MSSSIQVACPHCQANFLLADADIGVRKEMRCGACQQVFRLEWEDPGAPETPPDEFIAPPLHDPTGALSAGSGVPATGSKYPKPGARGFRGLASAERYLAPRTAAQALRWAAFSLALAAMLVWQVRYPFMEKYAQHPQYREVLMQFCEALGCELPARRDLRLLSLTHTDITLHPHSPGALRATVKLLNEAEFAQSYPHLQVTFSDRGGRVVGRRTFAPAEYLADGRVDLLAPGELGVMQFDFARPHARAEGFDVKIAGEVAVSR